MPFSPHDSRRLKLTNNILTYDKNLGDFMNPTLYEIGVWKRVVFLSVFLIIFLSHIGKGFQTFRLPFFFNHENVNMTFKPHESRELDTRFTFYKLFNISRAMNPTLKKKSVLPLRGKKIDKEKNNNGFLRNYIHFLCVYVFYFRFFLFFHVNLT